MALRLGLDFGTATTCLATVPDLVSFRPEVVPLETGVLFTSSAVFLDLPNVTVPIVSSKSIAQRAPVALFGEAESRFKSYWNERVKAQADGPSWSRWQVHDERERTMLLTYFKPELADYPVRRPVKVPSVRYGMYDALAQSDDVSIYFEERDVATPEPDTDDLIAATAAIIRTAVSLSVERYAQRVELLVIGMPSFGLDTEAGEAERAKQRRIDAVIASGVERDFGTADFRLEFLGEAQAAAYALDFDTLEKRVFTLVVDVGAGTTDLALVPYERGIGDRMFAKEPVLVASERFAGRDLNLAIALALKTNKRFREATDLLDGYDRRAWQLIMDVEMEAIKRALTREEQDYRVPFHKYCSHMDGTEYLERTARKLRGGAVVRLSLDTLVLRRAVLLSCRQWRERLQSFMEQAQAMIESDSGARLVAIELVGGAFRFEPLQFALRSAVQQSGLGHVPINYRNDGVEAQTAVARGLARWAAMQSSSPRKLSTTMKRWMR